MNDSSPSVERAALAWLARVNDPGFAAWDEWQDWLTQDPAHDAAYWRLAAAEAEISEALTARATSSRTRPSARPSPRAVPRSWMAAAAALVFMVLGAGLYGWSIRPQPWLIETGPGEQRTLDLADGTRIQVAGDTRLRLDRRNLRIAELESGRALFEVIHDQNRPFAVLAGDIDITDLGTVFDVTRIDDGGARIAVSEGQVRVDRAGQAVELSPGQAVTVGEGGFERRTVAVEAVAAWREGRLVYDDERLAVIAADLSRALGRSVVVAPDIADRRISGSLSVNGPPEALWRRLELLLDATVVRSDDGWRITGSGPR